MKRESLDTYIARFVAASVAVILVLIPFHAFLTVWLSSGIGHYTALRLWKECLLLLAGVGALYLLFTSMARRRQLRQDWLWRLIGLYGLVTVITGLVSYLAGSVTPKAVLYGELINLRPFVFLFVAWIAAYSAPWLYKQWHKLVLGPALVVVVIGLLQRFVLPYDVMKHFGYGPNTIGPYETIDHKTSYIRIRSTLRGANLLGAYSILVLGVVGSIKLAKKHAGAVVLMMIATLIVLYASGSRGAWLGAIAALAVLAWLRISNVRLRKLALFGVAGLVIVGGLTVFALRNNDFVQNTVFHTDEHSSSSVSSNSAHIAYSVTALKQIAHEPLGRGPGTAGQAGVYNTGHPARIAENNFLQIGQETGWLGLGLYVAILVLLAKRLWTRRQLPLAQLLLASLAGLSVMAMLMHVWADDTVAYLFFGLVGIALAQPSKQGHEKITKPSKKTFLQFMIFNLGGVMFFVVGYLAFVVLYGFFHWSWLPAKLLADFLGWTTNYIIQYFWAFREERLHHKHKTVMGKFTVISLVNLLIDYAIVGGLNWLGVSPFIGMIIAANFFTVWKWLWYKHWVFRAKAD